MTDHGSGGKQQFRAVVAAIVVLVLIGLLSGRGGLPDAGDDSGGNGGSSTAANVLSGHVRDQSGQPVSGIDVEIEFVVAGDVYATTDAAGYYAIPAGTATVGTALCEPPGIESCRPVGVSVPVVIDPNDPRVIDWVVDQ